MPAELKLVQRRGRRGATTEQDPALEPVRDSMDELVPGKDAGRDGKDVVELLKGALLGLGNPEQDEAKGEDVETGVEAKDANDFHGGQHQRKEDGDDGRPEQVGGDAKSLGFCLAIA